MKKRSFALALFVAAASRRSRPAPRHHWLHPARMPGATKYSTLDQINTSNVQSPASGRGRSIPATRPASSRARRSSIDGMMYLSAQNGVFALDPVSGKQLWKFETRRLHPPRCLRTGPAMRRRPAALIVVIAIAAAGARPEVRPARPGVRRRAASSRWTRRCSRRRRSTRTC